MSMHVVTYSDTWFLILIGSESSEYEDNTEIWSSGEEDGLLNDLGLNYSIPTTDSVVSPAEIESRALARWIIIFLMFVQATHKLSNAVISALIKFIRVLLSVLGHYSSLAMNVSQILPTSLYMANKLENALTFQRYVVCRKCHRIYCINECLDASRQIVKHCSYVAFPTHPHRTMRQPCSTLLMKTVELATGRTYFYPYLTYCYVGLGQSLQHLLDKPDFFDQCEIWRSRETKGGVFCDVYDGKVWGDFQCFDNRSFLSEQGNFALMMNMDFFQPYKHIQYSMGAIYVTVLNLPRSVRNKQENTILVGLIPGPHEPRHDINTFLDPFVTDLKKYWNGVELNVASLKCTKLIRCALLCVACDILAGRKVCGFLGHNAHLGCSRCYKRFSGTVGAMNYSGFDRTNWPLRSGTKHTDDACSLLSKKTKTELQKAESELGCKYTPLIKLPYFDAPRMLIIDPMHNLFLGSAKHFLKSILLDKGFVKEIEFGAIQQRVNKVVTPPDIGRIPHKILSGFSSFTADQWKNWVLYYSLIALNNILPTDILECWRHFVLACRVLCSKQLTLEQVMLADALLLHYCQRTERIFGWKSITPNMHLHCHLRACITDYGPLHGFWCYAFERYNGILGSMPNNNRSIEIQLTSRFLKENQSLSAKYPAEFTEHFQPFFQERNTIGSIKEMMFTHNISQESFSHMNWGIDHSCDLPVHCSRTTLTSAQKSYLLQLYCKLYSVTDDSDLYLSTIYHRYSHVTIDNKQFGSKRSRKCILFYSYGFVECELVWSLSCRGH